MLAVVVSFHVFFFSSRRRHTSWPRDWSSDVCSSDLVVGLLGAHHLHQRHLCDRVEEVQTHHPLRVIQVGGHVRHRQCGGVRGQDRLRCDDLLELGENLLLDRKSTRLNSSHVATSYAVFCLTQKSATHAD